MTANEPAREAEKAETADTGSREARSRNRAGFLTRRQLAARFGVHPITVSKWQLDGCPVAAPGGRGVPTLFSLVRVQSWREAKARAKQTGPMVSLELAGTRQAEQDALLKEQLRLARARELLPRSEVEKRWAHEVSAVRTYLLSAPVAWSDRIHRAAIKGGQPSVEAEVTAMIRQALEELSQGRHAGLVAGEGA
jgi:hypothetical protein